MNETLKVLETRRSCRNFKPDMVEKEKLEAIIEAGTYAATGMGKQSPIIIAVTNKELRDKIAEENRKIGGWNEGFDPFYGAPVILIVLADKAVRTYQYDGSLVLGNLMNAAESLGVSSIWIHRAKEEFESDFGKQILAELGIEGDGNDAILRQFGVGVKKVHTVWLVKEGDLFVYPKHKGMEMTPPEWEEKGQSQKVIRIVYPVEMVDGHVEYLISERESVKTNLFAHVRNNLMNETFGIVTGTKKQGNKEVPRTRYDATPDEKKQIDAKKEEIYSALRNCETLEDMLSCEIAKPFISAAWLDTPEAMVVRKMRNNAIKKYPKDFNAIASQSLVQMDETYQQVQEEIDQNANREDFIVDDVIDSAAKEKAPFEV